MADVENPSQYRQDRFTSEGIEICKPLWAVRDCNYHNCTLYRAERNLREYLVDEGLLKDVVITNIVTYATENPSVYRPIFNAIAEGLPRTKEESEFGMGKLSDYELFCGLKSDVDYERYSLLYNIEPDVLRKQWITIRSKIKKIQEHILARVALFPSKQYFLYCFVIMMIFCYWRLLLASGHYPTEPGYKEFIINYANNSFLILLLLTSSIFLYFIYDIYHFHYERNNLFLFYVELRRLSWLFIFCFFLYLLAFYFVYGKILPELISTI